MTPDELARVRHAIYSTSVSREAVEFDWPECHKPKCQARHADPDHAFSTMLHQIDKSVTDEVQFRLTSRADTADDDAAPREQAAQNLAVLLTRYTPEKHNTYMRAARAMVEAYPALVEVFETNYSALSTPDPDLENVA